MSAKITAEKDDRLAVKILRETPMEYRGGEDERQDRPGHVRAVSNIAQFAELLVVVEMTKPSNMYQARFDGPWYE